MSGPADSLTLLVVDDETAWVGALGALLGKAGHRIVPAYDGDEALRRFRSEKVDAVLLDLAMPGLDGAEVCRQIRSASRVPILIVSGERDRAAPAELLDLGADDFVRKGVPSAEILARVRAVMRRTAGPTAPPTPPSAGWELDRRRHEIRWQGQALPLTAIEHRLLALLVQRVGELASHTDLLAAGWPHEPDPDPLWLKPHLARLREKLRAAGAPLPQAVRGTGYRLEG